jgi:hypothetical protein
MRKTFTAMHDTVHHVLILDSLYRQKQFRWLRLRLLHVTLETLSDFGNPQQLQVHVDLFRRFLVKAMRTSSSLVSNTRHYFLDSK